MKLKFYMKSGNTLTMNHVEDWNIKYQGDEIISLNVTWDKGKVENRGVIIGSMNLSQIEAMEAV